MLTITGTYLAGLCWENDAVVDAAAGRIERAAWLARLSLELFGRQRRFVELLLVGRRLRSTRLRSRNWREILKHNDNQLNGRSI